MTYVFKAAIGLSILLLLIVVSVRPDMIEKEWRKVIAYKAEREAVELATIKEQHWRATFRTSADCANPAKALKQLECKNREENARMNFETFWAQQIAAGWKPKALN